MKKTSFKVTADIYKNHGDDILAKYLDFTSIHELANEYGIAYNTMHDIIIMLKLSKGLDVADSRVKTIAIRKLEKLNANKL